MTDYKIGQVLPPAPKTGARSMRDVTINGTDIRSRNYGAHLAHSKDPGYYGTGGMWNDLARKVACEACEECDARPDEACLSMGKKTAGDMLKGVHECRMTAARDVFGRKYTT